MTELLNVITLREGAFHVNELKRRIVTFESFDGDDSKIKQEKQMSPTLRRGNQDDRGIVSP